MGDHDDRQRVYFSKPGLDYPEMRWIYMPRWLQRPFFWLLRRLGGK